MNDEIREVTRQRMEAIGISQKQAARALGVGENTITRLINNTNGKGGKLPPTWEALLDLLGLELTVKVKSGNPQNLKARVAQMEVEQRRKLLEEMGITR